MPGGHRTLVLVGVLETLSLLVLLGNLATVHVEAVAQAVGPIHGLLYLWGIAATWALTREVRPRVLSVIPVAGALLAARVSVASGHHDAAPDQSR